jgi:hypothetical protein
MLDSTVVCRRALGCEWGRVKTLMSSMTDALFFRKRAFGSQKANGRLLVMTPEWFRGFRFCVFSVFSGRITLWYLIFGILQVYVCVLVFWGSYFLKGLCERPVHMAGGASNRTLLRSLSSRNSSSVAPTSEMAAELTARTAGVSLTPVVVSCPSADALCAAGVECRFVCEDAWDVGSVP